MDQGWCNIGGKKQMQSWQLYDKTGAIPVLGYPPKCWGLHLAHDFAGQPMPKLPPNLCVFLIILVVYNNYGMQFEAKMKSEQIQWNCMFVLLFVQLVLQNE